MWTSKYEPSMSDTIIACAREGGSVVSRCCAIEVTRETYYQWINPNSDWYKPDFHKAHEIAELLCQQWWEEKGQKHITFIDRGERLDAQNYRLQMMNRFGWSEKGQQEVNNTGDIVLNLGKKADGNSNG